MISSLSLVLLATIHFLLLSRVSSTMEQIVPSTTCKRRRTKNDDAIDQACPDFLALHRTLNMAAMPFFWLHRTLGELEKEDHETDHASCRQGIKSLSRQLLEVKRRLNPAAEECASEEDTTPGYEFQEARSETNPFETLGEGRNNGLNRRFMNRSAIKLANIDALMGFRLVQPTAPNEPFVFVDLCGAPGGFSEYITQRCCDYGTYSCYGYGLSLLGSNEHGKGLNWKLSDSVSTIHATTCHYSVCRGEDGTGDIYNWENVLNLKETMHRDGNPKAHLVVADGGFDAQRDCEDQEALSQKLLVCEVTATLSCLKEGGTMVLKMFGSQANTIRSMMVEIHSAFSSIHLTKPISSRPASAERYLIATGFHGTAPLWDPHEWRDSVFLGRALDTTVTAAQDVSLFLDLFDSHMLHLNLTACFSILSYLETKQREVDKDQMLSSCEERYEVPVERYRRAWRL